MNFPIHPSWHSHLKKAEASEKKIYNVFLNSISIRLCVSFHGNSEKALGREPRKRRKGQNLCGLWECEGEDFVISFWSEMVLPSARSSPSSLLALPGDRFPTRTCCAEHVPDLVCTRTSLLKASLPQPGQQYTQPDYPRAQPVPACRRVFRLCSALPQEWFVLAHLHLFLHIRDWSVGSPSTHKGVKRQCNFKG